MDNKRSNISATFHPFGLEKILCPFGQQRRSQIFFLSPGLGLGAKQLMIFQAISASLQDISLKIKLKPKFTKQIQIFFKNILDRKV